MSAATLTLTRRIHQAILDAYDRDALAKTLSLGMQARLDILAADKNFDTQVIELLEVFDRKGRVPELLRCLSTDSQGNEDLAALCTEVELRQSQLGAGRPILEGVGLPVGRATGGGSEWLWVNVPPKPSQPLVGRDALLDDLVDRLLSGRSPALSTDGLPGTGKTALAVALAHDERVQRHFTGGILWGGLGTSPDPATILNQWAAAARVELADLPRLPERVQRLSAALADRKLLVVLDDAWDAAAPKQLRLGCPHAVHLLTTRSREIARAFAELADPQRRLALAPVRLGDRKSDV